MWSVRSWGRTAAVCWRKTVVRTVVVMVVVQVFVATCVVSLWQLQKEEQGRKTHEWLRQQQEAPQRVGKYMLLFKSRFAPPADATTAPSLLRPQLKDDRTLPPELRQGVSPRVESVMSYYSGSGGGGLRRSDGGPRNKAKEEEEDPDVARGFVDEFVTYRSDDKLFLMFDDDNRNVKTTKMTPSYGHDNPVTMTKVPMKKSHYDDKAKLRSVLNTDGSEEDDTGEASEYRFKSYDPANPLKMRLKDDHGVYFEDVGSAVCFITGTDIKGSKRVGGNDCQCLDGYYGVDCGIPEAVWFDTYRNKYPDTQLRRRKVPRRIINGVTVHHEFAMFEARLHELYPAVDVFILAESNYTAHGDPKEFLFLKRLRRGYMKEFQDKLLYVSLDTFPKASETSGWVADAYIRYHLGIRGLPLLKGLREDDLFVLSDADELPSREVITFLKLYDGYPEPISFALQWNMFGFFWKKSAKDDWGKWVSENEERPSIVGSVVTLGMLKKVLFSNVFFIRTNIFWRNYEVFKRLKKYRDEQGHLVKEWVIGKAGHYAGWHCSWCFSPVDIVLKMDSAQANDEPRWGNMPEKKNLTYIASRIAEGVWFDDKEHFLPVRNTHQKHYAPRYLLQHPDLYRSLLYHPSYVLDLGQPRAPP
ncbi:beta-1,4-mannosyl-glycoprotein 4-beta-N-acetylglucosaminyltransferase-like isoform X2 [Portunus trituberculatus]|uniref:beta-1,4-mannosyl-glycoprotein 4-beta-N-acetylglucosaminyltransferase-like isoform X2 n=1 Tax=Portunus trituberculatus TaxID=210409 RepID=UPI001E1D1EF8|nr:beta-1,4-mannosyl-glycoprotein 4-beta-N-acetylglucosaminyltransferase-like isoform X2 [Portunus trituberculatus]